jgi:hypothetical protein
VGKRIREVLLVGKSNTWSAFGGKMGRPILFGGNHQLEKKLPPD